MLIELCTGNPAIRYAALGLQFNVYNRKLAAFRL
jgi:hypothetical protein